MSLKNYNCSLAKVSGLSMSPFFQTEDLLLLDKGFESLTEGQCVLIGGNVHRYILTNRIKGDRILYFDQVNSLPEAKVLGKIIKIKSKTYLTNHDNYILKNISKLISWLSNKNVEKNKYRKIVLMLIIFFSYSHRSIELFTLREFSK